MQDHHREYRYGPAVYGSILVASLVGAMFEQDASAQVMTLSLVSSIVIFWIAHAWSEVIGERLAHGHRFDRARIWSIAVEEWPLVESGVLPALVIGLAWLGVFSRDTATILALAVAILQLLGWGMLAGHRTQATWAAAIGIGAVDAALGIAIVALEIAVHHL